MKTLISNPYTNQYSITQTILICFFLIFAPAIMNSQAEMYKPGLKYRPTQTVQLLLPGSSKPQNVVVENINGKYIMQGDMIVEPMPASTPGTIYAAGLTKERRWPKGVIPFQIEPGHPFTMTINRAIQEINASTNLRLMPRTGQSSYVKIEYDADDGCWSNVGKKSSGVNKINLGSGCGNKGTIIHELLHTAGLFHEQSRTDRDRHIRIIKENIHSGKMHNFEKYMCNYDGIDIGGYDHKSVMHYPAYTSDSKFAKDVSKPIIETIPAGISIGQRDGLSQKDIAGINAMYPYAQGAGNQYDWTGLNAPSPVLQSNVYFGLQNIAHSKMVKYKKRKYGINLVWSEDLNSRNIKFELPGRSKTKLINGDKVAIYVKGKGYLRYKKREYGINIVWSDTPYYEWVVYSSVDRNILAGKPFSIYNTVIKQHVVYCKRKYGINLKWVKDCGSVDKRDPAARLRPRPRAVATNPKVKSTPRPTTTRRPTVKRTTRVVDHRKKN